MNERLKRLLKITKKKQRLIMGLMSGTSHDGIDAALVSIRGNGLETRVDLLCHHVYPYPTEIRQRIRSAFSGNTENICSLNFELGELFARTALECLKKSGICKDDLDIIASHGQTVHHIPPSRGKPGSTLQIGEADVIAHRTGILTISDFRKKDMAAGGHGAPLVPYADFLLFRKRGKIPAIQNIGGIANVTVVTEREEEITAFDTGPGNALIDEASKILSNGENQMDVDGLWGATGTVSKKLLGELMSHTYLKLVPPKSTGRETFGECMAREIIENNPHMAPEDLLATFTRFTAESIHDAYTRFILPTCKIDRLVISGGGCRNKHLLDLIREYFKDIPVVSIDDLGIPYNAKEAMSFAVLANETIMGMPGNLPSATGAKEPVVLGKISL